MRGKRFLVSVLLLGLMLGAVAGLSMAQGVGSEGGAAPRALVGTAFTYQGRLNKGGSPYTGQCDFRLSLHDALSEGNQVGNTQTIAGVDVEHGLLTLALNSGNELGDGAFNGDRRWPAASGVVPQRCRGSISRCCCETPDDTVSRGRERDRSYISPAG